MARGWRRVSGERANRPGALPPPPPLLPRRPLSPSHHPLSIAGGASTTRAPFFWSLPAGTLSRIRRRRFCHSFVALSCDGDDNAFRCGIFYFFFRGAASSQSPPPPRPPPCFFVPSRHSLLCVIACFYTHDHKIHITRAAPGTARRSSASPPAPRGRRSGCTLSPGGACAAAPCPGPRRCCRCRPSPRGTLCGCLFVCVVVVVVVVVVMVCMWGLCGVRGTDERSGLLLRRGRQGVCFPSAPSLRRSRRKKRRRKKKLTVAGVLAVAVGPRADHAEPPGRGRRPLRARHAPVVPPVGRGRVRARGAHDAAGRREREARRLLHERAIDGRGARAALCFVLGFGFCFGFWFLFWWCFVVAVVRCGRKAAGGGCECARASARLLFFPRP